jgi:hypothetical protein
MTKDVGDVVHLSKLSAESQRCEKRHFLRHLYIKCI